MEPEAEELDVLRYYVEEEELEQELEEEEDGGGKEFFDFEPLPTLLEDEENVSLADILSLRDNCLTEQDIWAICLECCYSLKSVAHSAIFQTLCITPDTLAFNTNGNVCFMEQLSDDPEGAFVPPEFDLTGNTLEAHVYSLGATLKAAIEFVIEPELETELCHDLDSLLELMQQENPADRPDIESIISLCESRLNCSSSMICRSLSSIGRRVLSIESVSTFQDGWEWKGMDKVGVSRKLQTTEKNPGNRSSVTDNLNSASHRTVSHTINSSHREEIQNGCLENGTQMDMQCPAPHSFSGNHFEKPISEGTTDVCPEKYDYLVEERTRNNFKKPRGSKYISAANNMDKHSPCHSPPGAGRITLKSWPSMPSCASPADSTGEQLCTDEASPRQTKKFICFVNSKVTDNSLVSCNSMPNHRNCNSPLNHPLCQSHVSYENLVTALAKESQHSLCTDKEAIPEMCAPSEPHSSLKHLNASRWPSGHEESPSNPSYCKEQVTATRHDNSPELDINEVKGLSISSDQQWISLKELVLKCGTPLNEEELWALCYECLYTLQTYIDYPDILCLESVFVDDSGEVLFFPHQNQESCDALCVPPEYDPEGVGSEKACVYGIAAILWSAAKLNFPCNHKLALPKRLKQFLLHMAKQNCAERPTIAESLKICKNYLQQRSTDSRETLARLNSFSQQIRHNKETVFQDRVSPEDPNTFYRPSAGFVPVSAKSKLMAVKGPVPVKDKPTNLPAAFTSPASYFRPIILTQKTDVSSDQNLSACTNMEEDMEAEISVSDIENHTDDKMCQRPHPSTNSSNGQNLNLLQSSISDSSSDCKEKTSSRASSLSSSSSTLTSSPVINNYILKQDPKTGNLKLVRVQLSVPEHMPSVSLEAGPSPQQAKAEKTSTQASVVNNGLDMMSLKNSETLPVPVFVKGEHSETKVNDAIGKLALSTLGLALESPQIHPNANAYPNKGSNGCTSQENVVHVAPQRTLCSPLQKVIQLIHEEFAFDGYLENGVEDLAMGEYIFALQGLQHATFCGAIREKFCDLYWDDHLLEKLYKVVSGKSPPSNRKERESYDQCNPEHLLKKVQRKSRKQRKPAVMSSTEQSGVTDSEETVLNTSQGLMGSEREMSPDTSNLTLAMERGIEVQAITSSEKDSSLDEPDMTDSPESPDKNPQSQMSSAPSNIEEHYLLQAFSDTNSYCVGPDYQEESEENPEDSLVNHRENNMTMSISPAELYKCSSGWCSSFYGAQLFHPEVQQYVHMLGRQKEGFSKSIDAKRLELEQQLMIETKNYRKTIKLYQNSLLKGKRSKGSDVKELLPKLKGHLEEMKSKVQFLELAKKFLQVSYAEQWGIEPHALPKVANLTAQPEVDSEADASFLLIYNEKGQHRDRTSKVLQAGTPLGLMAHLYSRNAFLDGYVQQFLYTFRYFCTQEDLLQFLIDRINCTAASGEATSLPSVDKKIYHRSLILLQTWIEDCCLVDFSMNPDLLDRLEEFSNSQVFQKDDCSEYLVSLLQEVANKKYTISSPTFTSGDKDDTKSLHSLCTKLSVDNVSRKSFNWKLSKGNGTAETHKTHYLVASALPRPCYPGFSEELSMSYIKADEIGIFSVYECTVQQIATQLTLLQEEMFKKCHPVHFLNSRALGVTDKSTNVPKNVGVESPPAEACSLFLPSFTQDKYLLQMLRFAENFSTWVSAEIVTCHTSKLQAGVLTKFLLVAKLCYEQRDFASAMQILGGLENLIVRQLPAWKSLPSKVSDILEELKAVEVFLKSDSLCLTKGDRFRTLPTIPSACLLAMHVQQLETGGFTMASGAFKWNKLRNIAKVVSQVHAFQEIPYSFTPDPELQFYLRQRIAHFSDTDISILAADNNANFHHVPSDKHSRKIQDTLRRMKATFQ
ncbi:kinase non-catalytic C-lobe domain-containing protein 1 isoform X2 [Xenopus laevis]|uniref:Kinase non-catalytic C-lobe domain-containing protein 1 isoform X2 n=1 Tax=Xenopus laevis TaxID=8355 RepID=A0A8J1L7M8_XENLA|nr:kinase non-catalytic C-lobe domain-containing protein 1 isoform X2 [Xenopus laevis]